MKILSLLFVPLCVCAPLAAETFIIDPVHSSVGFKVRHLMVSNVHGQFSKFEGWFIYDETDLKVWKASATIETASIDTRIPMRDDHLRSKDFFEAEKYPTLEYRSSSVRREADGSLLLLGDLSMHGVTKPVVLKLEVGGLLKDPKGKLHAGFSASGKISRKAFGLTYNQILEKGGVAIGDEVDILIEVEGVAK